MTVAGHDRDKRGGARARAAAVASAALASMCCILPLGFGALGVSTTVIAGFFEPLRPWFLTLAALLLAAGFYFALRPRSAAEVCTTDSRTLSKLAKPTLWISTAAVIGLAMFPDISGVAAGRSSDLTRTTDSQIVVLAIAGMTCASCAPGVRAALLDVAGVIDATVSYERGTARVKVRTERPPQAAALFAAVEKAGYVATLGPP